jgi:hypothetical protein
MISAYCVYISQLISYIVLRLYYPNIKREFHNPIPLGSVIYGLLVFSLSLVSVLGFVSGSEYCVVSTIIFWAACSLYYVFVSRNRQFFSEEEQKILFVAYIIRGALTHARVLDNLTLILFCYT